MIQQNNVSIEIEVFISRNHAVVRPSTSRNLHWIRHTVINLPSADTNLNSSIQPTFKDGESQNPLNNHCFWFLLLTPPTAINLSMWRNTGTTHISNQFISDVYCCLLTISCCDVPAFWEIFIPHQLGTSALFGHYSNRTSSPVLGEKKETLNFLQQEAHVANANSLVNTEYFWSRAELIYRYEYIYFCPVFVVVFITPLILLPHKPLYNIVRYQFQHF